MIPIKTHDLLRVSSNVWFAHVLSGTVAFIVEITFNRLVCKTFALVTRRQITADPAARDLLTKIQSGRFVFINNALIGCYRHCPPSRPVVICIDSPPYIKPAIHCAVKSSITFRPNLTISSGIMYCYYCYQTHPAHARKSHELLNLQRSYFKNKTVHETLHQLKTVYWIIYVEF